MSEKPLNHQEIMASQTAADLDCIGSPNSHPHAEFEYVASPNIPVGATVASLAACETPNEETGIQSNDAAVVGASSDTDTDRQEKPSLGRSVGQIRSSISLYGSEDAKRLSHFPERLNLFGIDIDSGSDDNYAGNLNPHASRVTASPNTAATAEAIRYGIYLRHPGYHSENANRITQAPKSRRDQYNPFNPAFPDDGTKPKRRSGEPISRYRNLVKPGTLAFGIPKLNRVEWQVFRGLRIAESTQRYVVDVLIGEPDNYTYEEPEPAVHTWPTDDFDSMGEMAINQHVDRFKAANARIDKERGPKTFYPVQGALPERIRINSSRVLSFLKEPIGGGLASLDVSHPLIIVRPFRALVHYQHQIREYCTILDRRYAQDKNVP